MNAWGDFNDAAPLPDDGVSELPAAGQIALDRLPGAGQPMPPHGGHVAPDIEQIAAFLDVVFGYCDGLIPVRGFVDQGQGLDTKPHNIWVPADRHAAASLSAYATWAAREGSAVYVIPGTVAEQGQARAEHVLQMQTVVVDLDAGDIAAKLAHLVHHLGAPTLLVESGGRTGEGAAKLHAWWRLTEPAEGQDLARVCALRGEIAEKVGGDLHFRSAHQPIRMPGTVHQKHGVQRRVIIREHRPRAEFELPDLAAAVAAMPTVPGLEAPIAAPGATRPSLDTVLTTPVREGSQDGWTRFQGASAAIGHFVRMVHEGRLTGEEGWEAICQYNAACLRPAWPLDRLKVEADSIWALHVDRNGPPLLRVAAAPPGAIPAHTLGALLDDTSLMPDDLIGPRLLTPGGMLVLGGAPKVGKSDFLISLLVHAAAGTPFLRFTAPRPLRVFYLQAEIQYHYLRERLQQLRLDPAIVARARDTLVVTPKLRMLLDDQGVPLVAAAIRVAFPDAPPDIICIDPIRNLFDGGPAGEGENDNAAMMFFLQGRVEALRDQVAPEAGIILAHHTKKLSKQQVKDDPFLSLSGASALRGYYTSGAILFRPDEEQTERELHVELRNGPGLEPMLVDKRGGAWVELDRKGERLVRRDIGRKLDAERMRRHDVILRLIAEEAEEGRLCTANAFASKFENKRGLGGKDNIRERIGVLAMKGYIKYRREARDLGQPYTKSKNGYLVVQDMLLATGEEAVDPETGEIIPATVRVLPSHFQCPRSEALLEVENPEVWVLHDPEEPA
ncbi:AAA family ATPase [Siccirubricoccus deserti]|uniref:AAA family ATPase n=1 Tax=Siccirubricoccus deserti TaxID=2013562 RepID=A0A9X0UFU6_9PROT|nr:AAA family ATPase [Siccirubricoccus deserti]MBC4018253.1 AAA family ATPase [Siccirubricoccus deserti]